MSDPCDDFEEFFTGSDGTRDDYYSEQTSDPACPFCARVEGRDYEQSYNAVVVRFEPLNPVTAGHMLFVPSWHVEHPSAEAVRVAMGYASTYGGHRRAPFNLITSSGSAATQTIPHIHVHYVPRHEGDGLLLPWSPTPSSPVSAAPGVEVMAPPDASSFGDAAAEGAPRVP